MAKAKLAAPAGIFDASDYQALRHARRALNELISKLDKARACGADCAMYEGMRTEIDGQLAQIEQLFMTPAPTG